MLLQEHTIGIILNSLTQISPNQTNWEEQNQLRDLETNFLGSASTYSNQVNGHQVMINSMPSKKPNMPRNSNQTSLNPHDIELFIPNQAAETVYIARK